jgi:putative tricarboxylic transport membrane protein
MNSKLNAKDIASGVMLIALAALGLYFNLDHPMGTARRMGPGYMPAMTFWLLGGLGLAVLLIGLRNGPDALDRWAWRELGLILASMAVFGVLLERIGFALAILVTVVISALADRTQTVKGVIGCSAFLIALCWLVFIRGLDIRVPFLPPFLGFY